jgi:uncharacterized protein YndB with AHSA1/START domain
MKVELKIYINRPPEAVFTFLRDKHLHRQKPGSAVLALDKVTSGEVAVGTRFREVVRMLPGYRGMIESEITDFQPFMLLGETFTGPGMRGKLLYHFCSDVGGTTLTQIQEFTFSKWMKALKPMVRVTLGYMLRRRLREIKALLERIPETSG